MNVILRMSICLTVVLNGSNSLRAAPPAPAPAWGDLAIRFVYDGVPPKPREFELPPRADIEGTVVDESLLVDPQSRGVANVVMFLLPDKRAPLQVHPAYAKSAENQQTMVTKGGRIEPHVLLVRTSQPIVLENQDPIVHNLHIQFFNTPPTGALIPPKEPVVYRNLREERIPCPVRCNIHSWLQGYVVVRNSPYMGKTDEEGKLVIKHLPVGEHQFRVWHEKAGYLKNVQVGEYETDSRGRLTVRIAPGPTPVLEALVSPGAFEPAPRDQKDSSR